MSLHQKFKNLAFESIFFQSVMLMLGFFWVFILSRQLDVSSMGKMLLIFSGANSVVSIFGLGLQHSLSVNAREIEDSELATNGLFAIFLLAFMATIFSAIALYFIFETQRELGVSEIIIFSLVFFLFIQIYVNSLIRAMHYFRVANWLSISQLTFFNIQIIIRLVLENGLSLEGVLISFLYSAIGSSFITLISTTQLVRIKIGSIKLKTLKQLFSFGGKVQIGNVLKESMYKGDLYLVGFILGSVEAGFYGVVLKLQDTIGRFVDAVGLVVLPVIARADTDERNHLLKSVLGVVLITSILAASGISINSSFFIHLLFGSEFEPSSNLLRIAIFALIPLSFWKILANDFIGRGLLRYYLISSGVGATIIVILNYILLGGYGLEIVPWIMIFSYTVSVLIFLAVVPKKLGVPLQSLFFFFPDKIRKAYFKK